MSSILRALKKLDEETRSQEGLGGIPKIEVDHMVTRHPQSTFRKVIFITLPVLVLVVAIWVMFSTRPETGQEKPKLPAKTTAATPTTIPQTKPETESQTESQAPPTEQESAEQEVTTEPPPATTRDEPVQTATGTRSSPPMTVIRDADGRRIGSRPAAFPIPQRKPQAAQASSEAKNPPKVRPQLMLEGILWSENIKRRVALIDDKYLKEGDTIKGITILRIEKKSVTLKSGEDTWSIRLKQ